MAGRSGVIIRASTWTRNARAARNGSGRSPPARPRRAGAQPTEMDRRARRVRHRRGGALDRPRQDPVDPPLALLVDQLVEGVDRLAVRPLDAHLHQPVAWIHHLHVGDRGGDRARDRRVAARDHLAECLERRSGTGSSRTRRRTRRPSRRGGTPRAGRARSGPSPRGGRPPAPPRSRRGPGGPARPSRAAERRRRRSAGIPGVAPSHALDGVAAVDGDRRPRHEVGAPRSRGRRRSRRGPRASPSGPPACAPPPCRGARRPARAPSA